MSFALLALGFLVLYDTLREPARERKARVRADFTAAGARFESTATRLVLGGLALLGAGLLALGTWAAMHGERGVPGDAAPAVGFGLFLLACSMGGAPREADVHFGRTEVRVGLRRIPYEAFHRFEVEEGGCVRLEGEKGSVGGRILPEEVRGLRDFLADRVFPPAAPSVEPGT